MTFVEALDASICPSSRPDPTGIVHTELQGDEWITFYYDEQGPQAIYRRAASSSNACTSWMIDFVATALLGLLGIMGVPLSTGVAVKAIQKLLGKALGPCRPTPKPWRSSSPRCPTITPISPIRTRAAASPGSRAATSMVRSRISSSR